MAAPHQLQFINPALPDAADQSFELFPMLAAVLRLSIWEFAVQQSRLVKVVVEPSGAAVEKPSYSTTNTLNKVVSGGDYTVTIQGLQPHSKLLRVNREARKVALLFYRIQIPCFLQKVSIRPKSKKTSTFYFNPEHDIIHVTARSALEQTFIAFLHDLRAHDPKDVGLLSLALEFDLVTQLDQVKPLPEGFAGTSFIRSLSNLQHVIWDASDRSDRGRSYGFTRTEASRYRHLMPIMSANTAFDVQAPHPRPVQSERQYIATASSDPRKSSAKWHDILERWGILQTRPAVQQVLFAYQPSSYSQGIHDVETAQNFLRWDRENWIRHYELGWQWHTNLSHVGKTALAEPDELAEPVRRAFGFWLFPIEALRGPGDASSDGSTVFELSGFEPEVALGHLYRRSETLPRYPISRGALSMR